MYNKKSLSYAGVFLSLIGICSAIYYRMNLTGFVVLDSAVNSIGGFFPLLFVIVGVAFLILGGEKATLEDIAEEVLKFVKGEGRSYYIEDPKEQLGKGPIMDLGTFIGGLKELDKDERKQAMERYVPLFTEAVRKGGEIGEEAKKFWRIIDPIGERQYKQELKVEDKSGVSNRLSNLEKKELRELYIGLKGGNVGQIAKKLERYGFSQEKSKGDQYRFSDRRGNFIDIPLGGIADDKTKRLNYASTAIGRIEESRKRKRDRISV